ncbi:MAG: SH3 domain-containing protein [Acidimicrobiia bacterium]|nr:SH3 domain-containing protein [Acidimicrobiia bacterium]
MQRLIVTEAWTSTYDDPIVVAPGEHVSVGRRDVAWPGFVWCIGSGGEEGWVPEEALMFEGDSSAIVARSYDAQELTVRVGDSVRATESIAGWTWCEGDDGRAGWVPDRCLRGG